MYVNQNGEVTLHEGFDKVQVGLIALKNGKNVEEVIMATTGCDSDWLQEAVIADWWNKQFRNPNAIKTDSNEAEWKAFWNNAWGNLRANIEKALISASI